MKLKWGIFLALLCGSFAPMTQVQAAEQKPIIVIGKKAVNPPDFSWVGPGGMKALTDAMTKQDEGTIANYVFAGAPGGAWAYVTSSKADLVSIEEVARRAVQECEFINHVAPCYILSINGRDGRDEAGVLPVQPILLNTSPTTFRAADIPFVTTKDQSDLADYGRAGLPRALVISGTGWWSWESGKNVLDAIAKVQADCQKLSKSETCYLYAVDDQVVFAPDEH